MFDTKTRVIDVHTHLFSSPEYLSRQWLERMQRHKRVQLGEEGYERWRASLEMGAVGTVESLVRDMDEAGVDQAVSFASGPFHPFPDQRFPFEDVRRANRYVADAQERFPDRVIGFVRPDIWHEKAPDLVREAIIDWGMKGVKIHPVVKPLTDGKFRQLFETIQELDVPVIIHQGVDPVPFLAENGNPVAVDTLTVRYPEMRIVAAHHARGFGELLEAVISNREGRVFTDLALWQLEHASSSWHFLLRLRHMMDTIPYAVVMASDWPWVNGQPLSHREWFDVIRNLELNETMLQIGMRQFSPEEKEAILGRNAMRWLGLENAE